MKLASYIWNFQYIVGGHYQNPKLTFATVNEETE